ncbi:hypothetical protein BAMBUS_00940 [Brevundimonas phage vB_BpoS-Bambus]|nr:hypothetical protein BAMBUS_00940 [Brevundimonas phage vB_BpoS-Bambus]
MTTKTTYEVMKRPNDSMDSYTAHARKSPEGVEAPAVFEDLEEAYAEAETLEPEFETAIRVVETTTHIYYL